VFIAGVADCVVVTTLFVTLLFVSVLVEDIVGTVTHSIATTQALTLDIVVSVACHSSIFHHNNKFPILSIDTFEDCTQKRVVKNCIIEFCVDVVDVHWFSLEIEIHPAFNGDDETFVPNCHLIDEP